MSLLLFLHVPFNSAAALSDNFSLVDGVEKKMREQFFHESRWIALAKVVDL